MSLEGKNIIITGATSGIAVAWALELSKEGASVFIGGRREDKGLEVAKQCSNQHTTFHKVDVASDESNKDFFAAAAKHFGGSSGSGSGTDVSSSEEQQPTVVVECCVDFIFLNAGVEGRQFDKMFDNNIITFDVNNYDYIFGVNVRGIISGLKYGTPLLRKGGSFVFSSSVASILPDVTLYGASKAAVDSLTRSYAKQFADSNDERLQSLSVYSINPTWYISEMTERGIKANEGMSHSIIASMFNPCQRPGTADDLAKTIKEMVKGNLPQYKSGANICTDGDTHFPLDEYLSRLKVATTTAAAEAAEADWQQEAVVDVDSAK